VSRVRLPLGRTGVRLSITSVPRPSSYLPVGPGLLPSTVDVNLVSWRYVTYYILDLFRWVARESPGPTKHPLTLFFIDITKVGDVVRPIGRWE
jgi:hypothetical protein